MTLALRTFSSARHTGKESGPSWCQGEMPVLIMLGMDSGACFCSRTNPFLMTQKEKYKLNIFTHQITYFMCIPCKYPAGSFPVVYSSAVCDSSSFIPSPAAEEALDKGT